MPDPFGNVTWDDYEGDPGYRRSSLTAKLTAQKLFAADVAARPKSKLETYEALVADSKNRVTGRVPNPRLSWGENAFDRFVQGAGGMGVGAMQGLGVVGDFIGNLGEHIVGNDDPWSPLDDNYLYEKGNQFEEWLEAQFPGDPDRADDFFGSVLPGAFGSMLGFIAGGEAIAFTTGAKILSGVGVAARTGKVAVETVKVGRQGFLGLAKKMYAKDVKLQAYGGKVIEGGSPLVKKALTLLQHETVKRGGMWSGGTFGALSAAGQQHAEALAYGEAANMNSEAAQSNAAMAALFGGIIGSMEVIPVQAIFKRAHGPAKAWFWKMLQEGFEEGSQEMLSELLFNQNAKKFYDQEREWFDGVGLSGGAGGIVGAVLGLSAGLQQGKRAKQRRLHKGRNMNRITGVLSGADAYFEFKARFDEAAMHGDNSGEFDAELRQFVAESDGDIKEASEKYAAAKNIQVIDAADHEILKRHITSLGAGRGEIRRTALGMAHTDGHTTLVTQEGWSTPEVQKLIKEKYDWIYVVHPDQKTGWDNSKQVYTRVYRPDSTEVESSYVKFDETGLIEGVPERQVTMMNKMAKVQGAKGMGVAIHKHPPVVIMTQAEIEAREGSVEGLIELTSSEDRFAGIHYDASKGRQFIVQLEGKNNDSDTLTLVAGETAAGYEEFFEKLGKRIFSNPEKYGVNKDFADDIYTHFSQWLRDINRDVLRTIEATNNPHQKEALQILANKVERAISPEGGKFNSAMVELWSDALLYNAAGLSHNNYGGEYSVALSSFSQKGFGTSENSGYRAYQHILELDGMHDFMESIKQDSQFKDLQKITVGPDGPLLGQQRPVNEGDNWRVRDSHTGEHRAPTNHTNQPRVNPDPEAEGDFRYDYDTTTEAFNLQVNQDPSIFEAPFDPQESYELPWTERNTEFGLTSLLKSTSRLIGEETIKEILGRIDEDETRVRYDVGVLWNAKNTVFIEGETDVEEQKRLRRLVVNLLGTHSEYTPSETQQTGEQSPPNGTQQTGDQNTYNQNDSTVKEARQFRAAQSSEKHVEGWARAANLAPDKFSLQASEMLADVFENHFNTLQREINEEDLTIAVMQNERDEILDGIETANNSELRGWLEYAGEKVKKKTSGANLRAKIEKIIDREFNAVIKSLQEDQLKKTNEKRSVEKGSEGIQLIRGKLQEHIETYAETDGNVASFIDFLNEYNQRAFNRVLEVVNRSLNNASRPNDPYPGWREDAEKGGQVHPDYLEPGDHVGPEDPGDNWTELRILGEEREAIEGDDLESAIKRAEISLKEVLHFSSPQAIIAADKQRKLLESLISKGEEQTVDPTTNSMRILTAIGKLTHDEQTLYERIVPLPMLHTKRGVKAARALKSILVETAAPGENLDEDELLDADENTVMVVIDGIEDFKMGQISGMAGYDYYDAAAVSRRLGTLSNTDQFEDGKEPGIVPLLSRIHRNVLTALSMEDFQSYLADPTAEKWVGKSSEEYDTKKEQIENAIRVLQFARDGILPGTEPLGPPPSTEEEVHKRLVAEHATDIKDLKVILEAFKNWPHPPKNFKPREAPGPLGGKMQPVFGWLLDKKNSGEYVYNASDVQEIIKDKELEEAARLKAKEAIEEEFTPEEISAYNAIVGLFEDFFNEEKIRTQPKGKNLLFDPAAGERNQVDQTDALNQIMRKALDTPVPAIEGSASGSRRGAAREIIEKGREGEFEEVPTDSQGKPMRPKSNLYGQLSMFHILKKKARRQINSASHAIRLKKTIPEKIEELNKQLESLKKLWSGSRAPHKILAETTAYDAIFKELIGDIKQLYTMASFDANVAGRAKAELNKWIWLFQYSKDRNKRKAEPETEADHYQRFHHGHPKPKLAAGGKEFRFPLRAHHPDANLYAMAFAKAGIIPANIRFHADFKQMIKDNGGHWNLAHEQEGLEREGGSVVVHLGEEVPAWRLKSSSGEPGSLFHTRPKIANANKEVEGDDPWWGASGQFGRIPHDYSNPWFAGALTLDQRNQQSKEAPGRISIMWNVWGTKKYNRLMKAYTLPPLPAGASKEVVSEYREKQRVLREKGRDELVRQMNADATIIYRAWLEGETKAILIDGTEYTFNNPFTRDESEGAALTMLEEKREWVINQLRHGALLGKRLVDASDDPTTEKTEDIKWSSHTAVLSTMQTNWYSRNARYLSEEFGGEGVDMSAVHFGPVSHASAGTTSSAKARELMLHELAMTGRKAVLPSISRQNPHAYNWSYNISGMEFFVVVRANQTPDSKGNIKANWSASDETGWSTVDVPADSFMAALPDAQEIERLGVALRGAMTTGEITIYPENFKKALSKVVEARINQAVQVSKSLQQSVLKKIINQNTENRIRQNAFAAGIAISFSEREKTKAGGTKAVPTITSKHEKEIAELLGDPNWKWSEFNAATKRLALARLVNEDPESLNAEQKKTVDQLAQLVDKFMGSSPGTLVVNPGDHIDPYLSRQLQYGDSFSGSGDWAEAAQYNPILMDSFTGLSVHMGSTNITILPSSALQPDGSVLYKVQVPEKTKGTKGFSFEIIPGDRPLRYRVKYELESREPVYERSDLPSTVLQKPRRDSPKRTVRRLPRAEWKAHLISQGLSPEEVAQHLIKRDSPDLSEAKVKRWEEIQIEMSVHFTNKDGSPEATLISFSNYREILGYDEQIQKMRDRADSDWGEIKTPEQKEELEIEIEKAITQQNDEFAKAFGYHTFEMLSGQKNNKLIKDFYQNGVIILDMKRVSDEPSYSVQDAWEETFAKLKVTLTGAEEILRALSDAQGRANNIVNSFETLLNLGAGTGSLNKNQKDVLWSTEAAVDELIKRMKADRKIALTLSKEQHEDIVETFKLLDQFGTNARSVIIKYFGLSEEPGLQNIKKEDDYTLLLAMHVHLTKEYQEALLTEGEVEGMIDVVGGFGPKLDVRELQALQRKILGVSVDALPDNDPNKIAYSGLISDLKDVSKFIGKVESFIKIIRRSKGNVDQKLTWEKLVFDFIRPNTATGGSDTFSKVTENQALLETRYNDFAEMFYEGITGWISESKTFSGPNPFIQFDQLSKIQLVEQAELFDIKTSGTKADLVDRLNDAAAEEIKHNTAEGLIDPYIQELISRAAAQNIYLDEDTAGPELQKKFMDFVKAATHQFGMNPDAAVKIAQFWGGLEDPMKASKENFGDTIRFNYSDGDKVYQATRSEDGTWGVELVTQRINMDIWGTGFGAMTSIEVPGLGHPGHELHVDLHPNDLKRMVGNRAKEVVITESMQVEINLNAGQDLFTLSPDELRVLYKNASERSPEWNAVLKEWKSRGNLGPLTSANEPGELTGLSLDTAENRLLKDGQDLAGVKLKLVGGVPPGTTNHITLRLHGQVVPQEEAAAPTVRPTVATLALRTQEAAEKAGKGINVLRKYNVGIKHFGNPWSPLANAKKLEAIKVENAQEAVDNYEAWLAGTAHTDIEQDRRKWILEQIDSGRLDNANLLYYKSKAYNPNLNHANSLANLVAARRGQPAATKTTADSPNRIADKKRIESKLNAPEGGNPSAHVTTEAGEHIATGYTRIVYGDHGPYMEFTVDQVNLDAFPKRKKKGLKAYYDEHRTKSGVLLYEQKRDVKHLPTPPGTAPEGSRPRQEGYADYVVGMFYVAADSVASIKGDEAPSPDISVLSGIDEEHVKIIIEEDSDGDLFLKDIFVKPKDRNKGYANEALNRILKAADFAGKKIRGWVQAKDERPIKKREPLQSGLGLGSEIDLDLPPEYLFQVKQNIYPVFGKKAGIPQAELIEWYRRKGFVIDTKRSFPDSPNPIMVRVPQKPSQPAPSPSPSASIIEINNPVRTIRTSKNKEVEVIYENGDRGPAQIEGIAKHTGVLTNNEISNITEEIKSLFKNKHNLLGMTDNTTRYRTQLSFGHYYSYGIGGKAKGILTNKEAPVEPLASWQKDLIQILIDTGVITEEQRPDSILINIYKKGKGEIPPHVDHLPSFNRPIVTIRFNEPTELSFNYKAGTHSAKDGTRQHKNIRPFNVELEVGDVHVMSGETANKVTHAIFAENVKGGDSFSITLRQIAKDLPKNENESYYTDPAAPPPSRPTTPKDTHSQKIPENATKFLNVYPHWFKGDEEGNWIPSEEPHLTGNTHIDTLGYPLDGNKAVALGKLTKKLRETQSNNRETTETIVTEPKGGQGSNTSRFDPDDTSEYDPGKFDEKHKLSITAKSTDKLASGLHPDTGYPIFMSKEVINEIPQFKGMNKEGSHYSNLTDAAESEIALSNLVFLRFLQNPQLLQMLLKAAKFNGFSIVNSWQFISLMKMRGTAKLGWPKYKDALIFSLKAVDRNMDSETRAHWEKTGILNVEVMLNRFAKAIGVPTVKRKGQNMSAPHGAAGAPSVTPTDFVTPLTQITKIIGGMQTGADLGGVKAARTIGIESGGTAPPGFATEKGSDPSSQEEFGAVEITEEQTKAYTGNKKWGPRTEQNVINSDGTVIFDRSALKNKASPGSILTAKHARQHKKPLLINPKSAEEIRDWANEHNIKVLNVAGNRESSSPKIQKKVEDILVKALTGKSKTPASENISSAGKGLLGALTNPTELSKKKGNIQKDYPITYKEVEYISSEAAYKAHKEKLPDLKDETVKELMIDIMEVKLLKYHQLVTAINTKGGLAWLDVATHKVKRRGDRWETDGMFKGSKGLFMESLIEAYKNVGGDKPINNSIRRLINLNLEDGLLSEGRLAKSPEEAIRQYQATKGLTLMKALIRVKEWRKNIKHKSKANGEDPKDNWRLITRYVEETKDVPYNKDPSTRNVYPRSAPQVKEYVEQREYLLEVAEEIMSEFPKIWANINDYWVKVHSNGASTGKTYLGFISNYMAHVYKPCTECETKLAEWARKKMNNLSRHSKIRSIPTYAAAQEMGFVPKSLDASDVFLTYINHSYKTLAAKAFQSAMLTLTDEQGTSAAVEAAPGNTSGPPPLEYDPPGYSQKFWQKKKPSRAWAFRQAPYISPNGFWVHPDYVKMYDRIVVDPVESGIISGLEWFNSVVKKQWLSVSFFHAVALYESGVSVVGAINTIVPRIPGTDGTMIRSWKHIMNPFGAINDYIKSNPAALDEPMNHGLILGVTDDMNLDNYKQLIQGIDKATAKIPGMNQAVKLWGKVNDTWDEMLWDNMHTGWKLYAYYDIKSKIMEKHGDQISWDEAGPEVAKYINDSFGGLNWDLMPFDNTFQRIMKNGLLAPDWTSANIRVAFRALHPDFPSYLKPEWSKYWIRMIVYQQVLAFAFQAGISAAFGDEEDDIEWNMFNNPGDKRFGHVNITPLIRNLPVIRKLAGVVDEEYGRGAQFYTHAGKQWREVMRLFEKPHVYLGSKTTPAIQIVIEQLSGFSIGGMETRFKKDEFWDSIPERAQTVADKFLPFSSQGLFSHDDGKRGGSFMLATPITREISVGGAKIIFDRRLQLYLDNPGENLLTLPELGVDLIDAMMRNGLSWQKIAQALSGSRVTSQLYERFTKAWKAGDVDDMRKYEMQLLLVNKDMSDIIKHLVRKEIITPEQASKWF